ncbi:hypothetical protein VAWG001_13630 [Aeromonas dhakensis]|nr:hypothetical protein VAWG001_13630 [Aeromonas dhakensis]
MNTKLFLMFIEPMIKGSASLMLLLSLTLSSFVYGAAYDHYSLKSDEVKGKNRICYYENSRGDGHTVTLPKAKRCKNYIKLN